MRLILLLLPLLVALSACNTAATRDVNSPYFIIPSGSKLIQQKPIRIPEKRSHVKLQHGRIVGSVDQYTPNCRFNVNDLGPSVVEPDSFAVSRAEVRQEWVTRPAIMRYYRIIYLESDKQPDVLNMTCNIWNDPVGALDLSVPQIREALGDYFEFEAAVSQK
jgi:hypothetical protein